MKFLFITLLFLIGCGTTPAPHYFVETQEMQDILDDFLDDSIEYTGRTYRLSHFEIKFDSNMPSKVLGHCNKKQITDVDFNYIDFIHTLNTKKITLNKKIWENASNFRRKVMLYHELGHCLLYREHNNNLMPVTYYPESIMYPETAGNNSPELRYMLNNWDYYLDELFNN